MIIYPAMDIINGECVRLLKGNFNSKTVYNANPLAQAQTFKDQGAKWLHIVDLDGAKKGTPQQTQLIKNIAKKTNLKIQCGGGLRRAADIKAMIAAGIERVVVGSLAVRSPNTIEKLFRDVGWKAITIALDINFQGTKAFVATDGWRHTSSLLLEDAIVKFKDMGCRQFLITDISRDGLLIGPNVPLYQGLQIKFPNLEIQVSGGISSLEDIQNLKAINAKSVIIGKALYEKKFNLTEAFNIVRESGC